MTAEALEWTRLAFSVSAFLISGAACVFAWYCSRRDDSRSELQGLKQRVTTVEESMRHMPTHNDLGKVYEELHETNRELATLSGHLSGASKSLDRIENYLLTRERGGNG